MEPAFEEPVLWRRNRDMALTVRSDVVDGVQGPYATAQIRPSLQPIVDSTVDLAKVDWPFFGHASWIVPLREDE
ncbi:hypothetical protein D3C83_160580 [compost metagenome]